MNNYNVINYNKQTIFFLNKRVNVISIIDVMLDEVVSDMAQVIVKCHLTMQNEFSQCATNTNQFLALKSL